MATPVYKAPPPVAAPCVWCGWYIGLNAGWVGSTRNNFSNRQGPILVSVVWDSHSGPELAQRTVSTSSQRVGILAVDRLATIGRPAFGSSVLRATLIGVSAKTTTTVGHSWLRSVFAPISTIYSTSAGLAFHGTRSRRRRGFTECLTLRDRGRCYRRGQDRQCVHLRVLRTACFDRAHHHEYQYLHAGRRDGWRRYRVDDSPALEYQG